MLHSALLHPTSAPPPLKTLCRSCSHTIALVFLVYHGADWCWVRGGFRVYHSAVVLHFLSLVLLIVFRRRKCESVDWRNSMHRRAVGMLNPLHAKCEGTYGPSGAFFSMAFIVVTTAVKNTFFRWYIHSWPQRQDGWMDAERAKEKLTSTLSSISYATMSHEKYLQDRPKSAKIGQNQSFWVKGWISHEFSFYRQCQKENCA